MLACVLRMHMSNEAVVFWNHTKEFKIMLRNDPVEADIVAFEVCIVSDEDEDGGRMAKVLEMEYDGMHDEGMFVVDTFSYDLEAVVRSPDVLDDARRTLNRVFNFTVCPCGKYFIKDYARMCMFCQLTKDSYDAPLHFCAICHEQSSEQLMVRQACCSQMLHRACLALWEVKSPSRSCPLCRHVREPRRMES